MLMATLPMTGKGSSHKCKTHKESEENTHLPQSPFPLRLPIKSPNSQNCLTLK